VESTSFNGEADPAFSRNASRSQDVHKQEKLLIEEIRRAITNPGGVVQLAPCCRWESSRACPTSKRGDSR